MKDGGVYHWLLRCQVVLTKRLCKVYTSISPVSDYWNKLTFVEVLDFVKMSKIF